MITLLIDTCLDACQAAVIAEGRLLASSSEPMQRGHQERIAVMTGEVMAEAAIGFAALTRIAVTLGPGSFTGIRVGLAFALGLGLATGAPIVGVGTLEALAASAPAARRTAGVVDARRGQVYLQAFEGGSPLAPPDILPLAEAAERLARLDERDLALCGPGARLFEGSLPAARRRETSAPDLEALARLAELAPPLDNPRPIYLRAPDIRAPAR